MTVCVLLHCKGARHFWITQEKSDISWFSVFYIKKIKNIKKKIECHIMCLGQWLLLFDP